MSKRPHFAILATFFYLMIPHSSGSEIEKPCFSLVLQPKTHRSQAKNFSKFAENSSMTFRLENGFTEKERSFTLNRLLELKSKPFDFDPAIANEAVLKDTLDINFTFRPSGTADTQYFMYQSYHITGSFFSAIRLHHLQYFVDTSLMKKCFNMIESLANKIESQRKQKIKAGAFWLRATSNELGHSVRPLLLDADSEGFHRHYNRFGPEHIDFAITIKGLGTRYKIGQQIMTTDEGDLLVFGAKVLHGSPDSKTPRLFLTGTFILDNPNAESL